MKAPSERRMSRTIRQAHDGPCGKPGGRRGLGLARRRKASWGFVGGRMAEAEGRLKVKTCDRFLTSF